MGFFMPRKDCDPLLGSLRIEMKKPKKLRWGKGQRLAVTLHNSERKPWSPLRSGNGVCGFPNIQSHFVLFWYESIPEALRNPVEWTGSAHCVGSGRGLYLSGSRPVSSTGLVRRVCDEAVAWPLAVQTGVHPGILMGTTGLL